MLYMFLKTGVWYFTVLLYPFGVIHSLLVFLGKMDRREKFPLRCLVAVAAIFAMMVFLPTFPDIIAYHIVYFLIINLFIIFTAWFVFDVSFFSLLACCSAGLCVKYIVTSIIDMFFIWSSGTGPVWVQLLKSVLNLAVSVALFFLLPKKFVRKSISYVNDKEVCIILSVSILFVIVFDQLSRLLGDDVWQKLVIDLYSIFGASLILVIQFFMLNRNKVLSDYKKVNFMLEMNAKRYELNSNLTEIANIKWHDFKHLTELFGERADGDDFNGARELIESTGSCALDAVLLANVISCRKNKIKFTWFCEKDALNGIDETDIYSVFCNLIDNAKEAVEEVPDDERRIISLVCSRETGNFVRIRMTNYFTGEIVLENGLPLTTKGDSDLHGYGLKSVKMIAEKYDGKIQINADGKTFELQLLLRTDKT